jgi:hypothetical protein
MYLTQQIAAFNGQLSLKNAKMKCSSVDIGGKSGELGTTVSPLQPLERGGCNVEERWELVRDTSFRGTKNCVSGFKGSQEVPACPSGRSNAYNRNYFSI